MLRADHAGADGSRRLLVGLADGRTVEAVLLPRGGLCVSSQVGCAVGCVFCMTGIGGLERQLGSAEIVAQVALARSLRPVTKVVFMGMGEPAHNLDAVLEAIDLLGTGGGLGHKQLVFSTVGDRRAFERLPQGRVKPALALSLHSTDAALRARLLPRAPAIAPDELVALGDAYARATGYPMQVQWTLLDGVNDGADEIEGLVRLLAGRYAVLNLIPYNTVDGLALARPAAERSLGHGARAASARHPHQAAPVGRAGRGGRAAASCGRGTSAAIGGGSRSSRPEPHRRSTPLRASSGGGRSSSQPAGQAGGRRLECNRRSSTPRDTAMGIANDLERLAELHRSGAISDAEFASAKARALGETPPAGGNAVAALAARAAPQPHRRLARRRVRRPGAGDRPALLAVAPDLRAAAGVRRHRPDGLPAAVDPGAQGRRRRRLRRRLVPLDLRRGDGNAVHVRALVPAVRALLADRARGARCSGRWSGC